MSADRLHHAIERLGYLLRADGRHANGGASVLQPVQRAALEYLARCNRYSDTPAAVTEFLRLTKGTVSQTLGVLARRGLIARRTDDLDRRVVHLTLTPAGRRLAARPHRVWRNACQSLGAQQIAQSDTALARLLRAVERAAASRSFGDCHDCRLLRTGAGGHYRCGLTGEDLTAAETRQICREHIPLHERPVPGARRRGKPPSVTGR
jgi:DNA-binding MarR family transcriptional regulator